MHDPNRPYNPYNQLPPRNERLDIPKAIMGCSGILFCALPLFILTLILLFITISIFTNPPPR